VKPSSSSAPDGRRKSGHALGGARATLRPALPYLVPVAGALALAGAGRLERASVVVVGVVGVLCALVRLTVEHLRTESLRARADAWLVAHTGEPPNDDVLLARIEELLRPANRRTLAGALRRVAADALSSGRPLSPAQLNRRQLRRHVETLFGLAERLEDVASPVSPRGVALTSQLASAGGGPLYDPRLAAELPLVLERVARALEAR
jgi:hypothetical protein